jgi:hypothetical protein
MFLEIWDFCSRNSFFSFNNEIYEQIEGSGMGMSKSPIEASIVMEYVVEQALQRLDVSVGFFKVYVDDCITSIPKDSLDHVIKIFNSINPKIQFTSEVENDGKLAFLDMMLIHHTNGSISTVWNQKEYASGRLLNFNSCHPIEQKVSTAYGLINRVMSLTSEPSVNKNEVASKVLINNGYPKSFVARMLNRYAVRLLNPSTSDTGNSDEIKYRSLTFIDGLSQRIHRIIKSTGHPIKLAFKSLRSLSGIYKSMKDKDNKWLQSSLIYRIPCNGNF